MRTTRQPSRAALALVIIGLFLASVGSADARLIELTPTLSYEIVKINRTIKPPPDARPDTIEAEIDISYPRFSASKPGIAVDKINQAIVDHLLSVSVGDADKSPTSIDALITSFTAAYHQACKESPDLPGGWSLKFEALVRFADQDHLSLDVLEATFLGGAHPNSLTLFVVLSLKTGDKVPLKAFVPDQARAKVTRLAEGIFREARDIKPDQSYQDAGFTFEEGGFALNENFLVSDKGLEFYYNPYEIAPYALGGTHLTLPWPTLKPLLK